MPGPRWRPPGRESAERSLQELSRVACYLGLLLLAISIHRERERAVKHTVHAIAASVVLVACLALASRLRPDLFPAAHQTASFLPGTQGRLGWPLNYWNALAALLALGLPLLLAIATSARTLPAQAGAAAAIPIVTLCGYLTFSRGGAVAAGVGLLAFFVFSPERLAKLATALVAAAGSAALILATVHRAAIEQGLTNGVARHQGETLLVALVVVCAGVALAQTGVGLAVRHGTPPRWLTFTPGRARALLLGAVAVCVVVALLAGAPARVSHAWQSFKHPSAACAASGLDWALRNRQRQRALRLLEGGSRRHRCTPARRLRRRHVPAPVGATGPVLQLRPERALAVCGDACGDRHRRRRPARRRSSCRCSGRRPGSCTRSRYEARVRAAGLTGALIAFCVAAASDWIWQVPAVPAAFLLLAAAVFAPPSRSAAGPRAGGSLTLRLGAIAVAIAALVAIAIPLATVSTVRASQAAVLSGNPARALADARAAVRLEPGAASPQIQLALVLELQGDVPDALAAARSATIDEPGNWSGWLIVSRLEAEAGHPAASLAAYGRSRSLNPRSPLFKQ